MGPGMAPGMGPGMGMRDRGGPWGGGGRDGGFPDPRMMGGRGPFWDDGYGPGGGMGRMGPQMGPMGPMGTHLTRSLPC